MLQVFGEALTLGGFPPWAARAAELYGAGPLRGVTAARLHAALRRYRRTRQRFGR
jgi:undecaprenyl pyrophosphate synthase